MRRPRVLALSLLLPLALLAAACGGGGSSAGPTSAATSAPAPASAGVPRVALQKIADIDKGTAVATRVGDGAVYVTEQDGRVLALHDGRVGATPVLDLRSDVLSEGERGLLGLAFAADGATLYAYWTAREPVGQITVASFPFDGTRADPSRRTVLLTIDHAEFSNHDGGILQLGPDGLLYLGVGDGGSGGDPHGNGQNTRVLLGKVLRIDPTKPADGRPYGIPPGNPFAGGSGGRPEVWAYGLRNPWRLSFDPPSGSLWIADVGQDRYEEVDRVAAATPGVNYGWGAREGLHAYEGSPTPAGAVDPVDEQSHADGFCSVTGGFVYRGRAIPGLVGRYVFGDYCNPTLQVLSPDGARWARSALSAKEDGVRTFGVDPDGELLVVSTGGLSRLVAA